MPVSNGDDMLLTKLFMLVYKSPPVEKHPLYAACSQPFQQAADGCNSLIGLAATTLDDYIHRP